MNKITLAIIALLFVFSCGVKQTKNQLTSGNYDEAIGTAVKNLRNNKDKKGKQEYVLMLEEAYSKAKDRDLRQIDLLMKDANPANLEKIYNTYLQLNDRQEIIRPILPLKVIAGNRNAEFKFEDYSDQIVSSKGALSRYLYDNTVKLLNKGTKADARTAFDDLNYLESLSPGYKDIKKLKDEAKFKGTDFVSVFTRNETNMVIPKQLEKDMLDFSTFGLNDKWTVYHSNKLKNINYDYGLIINFRDIKISPEQLKEKEFTREREIKDGRKKLRDRNGNIVLDSLGNAVMVDNMKIVSATIYEFRQFKACQVSAKVDYVHLNNEQLISSFPIASEFVFENIYSKYRGDKRAVEDSYQKFFNLRPVAFPSNEKMVYDSGEDLKAKLKGIITKNNFY